MVASSIKMTKHLLPPRVSTSLGPQTSEYTNSNVFNFFLNPLLKETLCYFPTKQRSQEYKDSFLAKGIKNFLSKTCNPFALICPNLLCHNSKEVPSIAYNSSLQTFPWVLYKVQHASHFTTTNAALVSFNFPLPKWFS